MAEPILELAKALATRLTTELAAQVERRYAPYFERSELEDARWVLLIAQDETSRQSRGLANGDFAIDVALQQAVPERENRDDPEIPIAWCDARIEDLGRLKNLFRPGGVLRDELIANCEFKRYESIPLVRPDLLVEQQMFTGVVRLIYVHEFNNED